MLMILFPPLVCLISGEVVRQLGLGHEPLASSIPAQALDGHHLGNIRNWIGAVIMLLPGNHREEIHFHILEETHLPLALGYPWLHHHNPHLNWETGEILEWGAGCHPSCLVPAPTLRGTVAPAVTPPNVSGVPEQYHNLAEVFSKARATTLPLHRPYDCATDLLQGTVKPKGRLYSLLQPELRAMEEYITSSLVARLI